MKFICLSTAQRPVVLVPEEGPEQSWLWSLGGRSGRCGSGLTVSRCCIYCFGYSSRAPNGKWIQYMYSLHLLGCSRSAISARCGPLQSWGIAVRHVKMEHCAPADYRSAHRPGDTLPPR